MTAWLGDLLGVVEEARYPYPVLDKTGPLTSTDPDLSCVVDHKQIDRPEAFLDRFPELALQQYALVRVFDCSAAVSLAVEDTEGSALEVFQRLQGFGAQIEAAAFDFDLGGELVISTRIGFDYSVVFERTEGGTASRLLVCEFAVAEPFSPT